MNTKNILAAIAAVCAGSALAAVEMGAPFTDGAVLQRGMKVPVWGKVVPGPLVFIKPKGSITPKKVKVEFAGQTKVVDVGLDGKWRVDLDPMEASSEAAR